LNLKLSPLLNQRLISQSLHNYNAIMEDDVKGIADASKSANTYAKCNKEAKLWCAGCVEYDLKLEHRVGTTWYCSKDCQVQHCSTHKATVIKPDM
jgi:hypothetical protein